MRLMDSGISVLPSSEGNMTTFWAYLKWACAALYGFATNTMYGTNEREMIQIFLMFVVWDFITGVFASALQGKVKSGIAWRGILKKLMFFAAIGFAHAIDVYLGLGGQPGAGSTQGVMIRLLIGLEIISIGENLAAAGIVLPRSITDLVARITSPSSAPGTTVQVDTVETTKKTLATIATTRSPSEKREPSGGGEVEQVETRKESDC
jgi:toxin secretion/phage lysis holin